MTTPHEQAVEAVARAIFEKDHPGESWEINSVEWPDYVGMYIADARTALAAAATHFAEAFREWARREENMWPYTRFGALVLLGALSADADAIAARVCGGEQ